VRAASAAGADASLVGAHSSLNTFTKMTLDEYVKVKGGNRVINKILIANNGIAAVKAIRSMRRSEHRRTQSDTALPIACTVTGATIAIWLALCQHLFI